MDEPLDADPITQFQRWFAEAVAAGEAEPTAMTVATASVVLYLVLIGKTNQTLAFIEQGAASVVDAILWHRESDHEPKQRAG